MKYSKGQKGPESRTRFTILSVEHRGSANGRIAKGTAIAHLRSGDRGVSFLAQGRHCAELEDRLVRNGELVAMVRWTGREAVTITGAAHIQPAIQTAVRPRLVVDNDAVAA